ncbi:MAG: hypothetical protein ACLSDQ_02175 [Adlercreutzia equolifaciens]
MHRLRLLREGLPLWTPVLIEELNVVHRCDGYIDLAAGRSRLAWRLAPCARSISAYRGMRAAHPDGVNRISVLPEPTTDPSVVIDARQAAFAGELKQLVL